MNLYGCINMYILFERVDKTYSFIKKCTGLKISIECLQHVSGSWNTSGKLKMNLKYMLFGIKMTGETHWINIWYLFPYLNCTGVE